MTEQDFLAWLAGAVPGATIEYHQGFLARDRSVYDRDPEKRNRLSTLASRAMIEADRGRVHLVQSRIGADRWSYLAIAAGRVA